MEWVKANAEIAVLPVRRLFRPSTKSAGQPLPLLGLRLLVPGLVGSQEVLLAIPQHLSRVVVKDGRAPAAAGGGVSTVLPPLSRPAPPQEAVGPGQVARLGALHPRHGALA